MGLMASLGLPERPQAIQPQKVMNITDSQGAEVSKSGARPIAVVPTQPAEALRGKLEAKDKTLRDAYAKLTAAQPRLEAAITGASGDTKKAMEAQKADVDKHVASIERQLKTLDADRKALDDPRTDAKAMNDILARNKSGATVGTATEVDRHDGQYEKKPTEKRETTTTTAYADGTSTTRTSDKTTSVGLDGVTRKTVESKEKQTATDKSSTSVSRTDKVSKDGYSGETVQKHEHEADGQTSSVEKKSGIKIGLEGYESSKEQKITHADGSGTGTSSTGKLERGDGKAGASKTSTTSKTDASGNTTSNTGTAKGGLVADKDGIGGYGEGERAIERKGAGGLKTGAVAGLNAKITCNVTEIEKSNPPAYRLTTRISLGASLSASAGRDKEGSEGKVGVKVSGSAQVYMDAGHDLGEAEAAAYVAALKTGSGTQKEFAIIRTGLSGNWDKAREMYLAMSGKTGSAADVDSMQAGDSKTVGKKTQGGVAVSGDAKGVGVELGIEKSHDQSMMVTKEKDGSATYETNVGDGTKKSAGGKLSVGVVEGSASVSRTVTTTTGYKLHVTPDMKNPKWLQDQIAKLSSQKEIDEFAKAHPETVVQKTETQGVADTQAVGVGIGGAKVGLNFGHGIEESKTTDAQGKVIGTQTKGTNTGGMEVKVGKLTIGASTTEEAVAKKDADGETTLDVTRSDKSTDAAKFLGSLPVVGDKKDKKKGALATVTGAEEEQDTDTRDVQGISLKGSDLAWLAETAGRDMKGWMGACDDPQLREDWRAAANEVRKAGGGKDAVAKALARFVGKDPGKRAGMVNKIVRPAGDVSSGTRYEYPDSVAKSRGDYEKLVIADCVKDIVTAAKEGDVANAQKVGADLKERLRSLYSIVNSATDFKQPAVRSEMLSAISERQAKVATALKALSGPVDPKSEDRSEYARLLENCIGYQQTENDCFAKIEEEYHKRWSKEDAVVIATLIKQVRDLQALWRKEYDKMAMYAQENNLGKDTYWKYKPDVERFNRAVKGHPGAPSAAKPETADKKRNPDAVSEKGKGEMNRQVDSDGYKNYQKVKLGVETTRTNAQRLGNDIQALMKTKPNAAAAKLVAQAEGLFEQADDKVRKCRPDHQDDMADLGSAALEQFRQALALLNKARAMYPK